MSAVVDGDSRAATADGDGAAGGAFVTLERGDRLRGCCGLPEYDGPLVEAVVRAAKRATLADPRFPSVSPPELSDLTVSVTALSPSEPVPGDDPAAIREAVEVGRHGLIVSHVRATGLLLPQVPVEQGWDTREFLRGVCRKAGLPPNAWRREDVDLERFTGQVFAEREPGGPIVERGLADGAEDRPTSTPEGEVGD